MEKIVITGGKPLHGAIEISGMKNSAVAVILATVLIEDICVIENVPDISDVKICFDILTSMGIKVRLISANTYEIDSRVATGGKSPYDLVRKMRASYYLIGAELGRFGKAHVGLPGGCDFGVRPIDQHIKGFEALGATVTVEGGYVDAKTDGGVLGGHVYFDGVTVGGTMNVIMAAVRAEGQTVIENAAREPHIVDLANFLNACGAQISGAGTDVIKITGVKNLHGCTHAIIPDMIEAGTFMIAAAATKGALHITNVIPKHLESVTAKLTEMGVCVEEEDDAVFVSNCSDTLSKINVKTQPYPGFPTDLNPQMCVLLCLSDGDCCLTEGVWDNRFRYVEELKRMGASISVDGKTAVVEGNTLFSPARVRAVDLRAGAAMILAALVADGTTEIEDVHHIQRGYDNIVEKLRLCGADIRLCEYKDIVDTSMAN
ncbi:MAG: UDP-N-acetylglucosamine 1-carboxyvinyltransferase [Clostridia bacterium]|nr:UDP-N-acetylglucosamine 1-carboxyvinyltransferase [Clostridia bacterium]